MANYVFILQVNNAGEITEHLGTDWVRGLDGRLSLANQIYESGEVLIHCDRYYKEKQPGYIIRQGRVTGPVMFKYIREEFKNLPQDID